MRARVAQKSGVPADRRGRDGLVLQVTDKQEPALTGDDFAKAKDNLQEQIVQQKRQEAIQLFLSSLNDRLEKEGKIKTNKTELENLSRRGRS